MRPGGSIARRHKRAEHVVASGTRVIRYEQVMYVMGILEHRDRSRGARDQYLPLSEPGVRRGQGASPGIKAGAWWVWRFGEVDAGYDAASCIEAGTYKSATHRRRIAR